ncbi:hypothetical protein [Lachnoclostridium sp. MSJ-17]|uniref:hypothetical protein n=1 Tax=Lachnoclostridium sp. MSJ-17 TaxID=2841516 RepID=UPI001C114FC1|nr:hypothetical protein [Lachnoclostridium sp. MSJ-17]MBU5461780.1 hypothetical protein [Lachnoclostridium sp. MSJ-17]
MMKMNTNLSTKEAAYENKKRQGDHRSIAGGEHAVRSSDGGSTAAGSSFRYSSNNVLVTRYNGQIQTVDNGVRPDIYLSNARMYDRTYISQVVDNAFPQ